MNRRFSKGMAALLVMLLALQAPVALALACADHGPMNAEATTAPMSEADCHSKSKVIKISPQPADSSDCCDDCACPTALAVALTSTTIEPVRVPIPELIKAPTTFFVSLHPDRILHPPIS